MSDRLLFDLQRLVQELQGQVATLQNQINDLATRLTDLEKRTSSFRPSLIPSPISKSASPKLTAAKASLQRLDEVGPKSKQEKEAEDEKEREELLKALKFIDEL
ncbi:MAG: hypothetical protein ACFFC7_01005 [Candidatus Hermodarchaeota archaeon]